MNKKVIVFMMALCSGIGSYVPVLLGDSSMLDGWSILGGVVGGFIGIWLGAGISKRYS
jgi:hypothetical protein